MKDDVGLRRCGHCGAFDAWTGEIRRTDLLALTVLEHECGICGQWWRVPIRRPISVVDVKRDRL